MKSKVVSRLEIAACRRKVARQFEITADKISTEEVKLRGQGKKLSDERREEMKNAKIQAKIFRDEEARYTFASRLFGDDVLVGFYSKKQAQKDELELA